MGGKGGRLKPENLGKSEKREMTENMANMGFMGFPNYSITEDGRVYSHKGHKFLKPRLHQGYLHVNLYNKKCYAFGVHQLVAKAFVKGESDKLVVNHIDGNKLNNTPSNLEWVTQRDNVINAIERGAMYKTFVGIPYKAIHEACKLLCDVRVTYREICRRTGIGLSTLKTIASGKSYTEISCQYDFPKRGKGFKRK